MASSDSVVLAGIVGGIPLAVNMDRTRSDLFKDCYELLDGTGTPILGYLLDNVKSRAFVTTATDTDTTRPIPSNTCRRTKGVL